MLKDPELSEQLKSELPILKEKLEEFSQNILIELTPKDPADQCDVYLEVRAGTGGEEAALFASDLDKMYNYISQRLAPQIVSITEASHGGYKEIIMQVKEAVYGTLKYESGGHRYNVPTTEQGRIHTSACIIAVLPLWKRLTYRYQPHRT